MLRKSSQYLSVMYTYSVASCILNFKIQVDCFIEKYGAFTTCSLIHGQVKNTINPKTDNLQFEMEKTIILIARPTIKSLSNCSIRNLMMAAKIKLKLSRS